MPGPPRRGKGSDDEAEDEDEGDLDQYRVLSSPEKKEAPVVVPGVGSCREMTNGHSESTGETGAKTTNSETKSDEKVEKASSVDEVKCPNS